MVVGRNVIPQPIVTVRDIATKVRIPFIRGLLRQF